MPVFEFMIACLIEAVTYVFKGFCLKWLWLWFMVPLGLPAIGVAWSIGIVVIVSRLTIIAWSIGIVVIVSRLTMHVLPGDFDWDSALKATITEVVAWVFALIIGSIAHGFM